MNPFDAMYEGTPPWDIGRAQGAIRELVEAGKVSGRVLDAGCGTGDLVLLLAELGLDVWGIELSERALRRAKDKVDARGVRAHLVVGDAGSATALGVAFDTVVDCGLFHTFTDPGRARYRRALEQVLRPGGVLHLLCFSDAEPGTNGPRRVSEEELRETFSRGWFIDELRPAVIEHRLSSEGARAWRLTATWFGTPVASVQ